MLPCPFNFFGPTGRAAGRAGRCRWPRSMTEGARFLHHPKAGPASGPTPRSGPTPTTAAGWPATERLDGVHGLRTAHWPSWVIPLCHADIRYTVFAYQGNDGVWRQTLPSGWQQLAGQGLQIGGSSHGCGIVSLHRLRLLLGMVEVRVEGLAALRDPNQPSGRCWPLHERGSPWPNGCCGRGIDQTGTAGHVNLTSEAPEPRERPTTPDPNVANTTGQRCARRSPLKLRWIGERFLPRQKQFGAADGFDAAADGPIQRHQIPGFIPHGAKEPHRPPAALRHGMVDLGPWVWAASSSSVIDGTLRKHGTEVGRWPLGRP